MIDRFSVPVDDQVMPRYAYRLRIKPDAIEEYEREHQRVWPELLAKLKEVVFRLFHFPPRTGPDAGSARGRLRQGHGRDGRDPVNRRWQVFMSRLFEAVPDKQPDERFSMWKEVFYLE